MDTTVITDRQEGRIDETDAGTLPKQVREIATQQGGDPGNELDKPSVTDQARKFRPQILLHVFGVVRLERPILALVKMDQDRHDFTRAQVTCSTAMDFSVHQEAGFKEGGDLLVEIIDMAIQFE